jgi:class 3 adenylate cyclase
LRVNNYLILVFYMSSIICFDIRNFSNHVSYLASNKKADIIFELITSLFNSLHRIISKSRKDLNISGKTYINHTGDGFIAIFYDKGRSLQSLFVASLLSKDVEKLLKEYEVKVETDKNLKQLLPPLDYGIGIHLGRVEEFKYSPKYPNNQQILGFLGNAINISYRVQESTKDHIFRVICTKRLYGDAIKVIKDEHKETFKECFTKLDKHNLRGMSGPYTLYGLKKDLARKIKPNMILS